MLVGLVLVEDHLVGKFNKEGYNVVDHYIYVLVFDGDLMEGILYEVVLFVGYNKLSKLVVLYDLNDILLDGELNKVFFENIKVCFEVYGWNYLLVKDGNDLEEIDKVIIIVKF